MAAPGRVREPRLVLPARDANGDPPRLRAQHGRERARMGVVCGSLSQTTLLSAITIFTDWPKMVCSLSCKANLFNNVIKERSNLCISCVLSHTAPVVCLHFAGREGQGKGVQ